MEARACRLPIITYDTGGSVEASGDALYASVPKGDLNSACDCIYRLKKYNEFNKVRAVYIGKDTIDKKTFTNRYVRKIEYGEN